MKEFKIKLSSNVDELMAQFAAGSKELKEFAKNANAAQGEAEKLSVLKETVAYISQMDKALSKLKKNQPDIFKQIFGSVDKDMKAAMQPLMQMPKEMGTLITKIGKQLDGIRSGKIEATNSEMKALGETFRGVAKALNMEVDLSFLDGTSKAKVKADKLTASMEQLAKAYYNVHKAEVSTGLSLTLPDEPKKKRTKKSSGTGAASSGETPTISNSGDIKTVETLANSYTKLRKEVEKIKGGEDIDGIVKAFKIAEGELDRLENILYNVDEPLSQTMAKMREFLGTKFPEMSFKDVKNSVQRFLDIQKELDNVQTDEGFDRLSNEADQIRDEFYQLSSATENIFDGLTDNLTLDDAVKQLSDLLGVEVVQAAQSAGDAAAGIEGGLKESGQAAEDTTAKVKVLENAISEVIRNAGKHKLEFSVVLNREDVTVRKGASATATDIVEDVGNMMSSLGKYFIDSHVHTTTSTMTDDADLKYFASLKKYGVTNHNAIMGPDGATLYDFSQVSDSDMEKAIKMVEELRKSGVASREEVENIFKSLNSGYDVIKSFSASQMGEFAQYIYDISKNAQASIDPLNQFKAIINHLTDGKIDLNKYSKLFEDFKPENAKSIFDQIVNTETNGQPDMYDFSKKSMADVISELANTNAAGQQLADTFNDIGQAADGAGAAVKKIGDDTSGVDNQIKSYEELIGLLKEYQDLERSKKKLDNSSYDLYIDALSTIDEYGQDDPQAIMKAFNDAWKERKALKDNYIKSPEFIDPNSGASVVRKAEIAQKEEEIKRLAAAYIYLGGSIDNFKSKEKQAFAAGVSNELQEQRTQMQVAEAEIDAYNQKFVDRQSQIAKMLWADGTDIGNTAELIYNVESFKSIEESAQKMAKVLGIDIPQAIGTAVASVEDLSSKAEEAKQKFLELTKTLDSGLSAGNYNEFSLGKSQADLDNAQKELQNLAEKGYLAKEALDEVNAAYKKTSEAISASYAGLHNENMLKEEAGSYDRGYSAGYLDAEKRLEAENLDYTREANELRSKVEALETELANARKRITSGSQVGDSFGAESDAVKTNIQAEIDKLKRLEDKIFDVKHAVEQKIQAFVNERKAVDSNVGAEIEKLESLRKQLEDISTLVNSIKKIKVVADTEPSGKKKSKPLEGEPLNGEQLGMDLGKAAQDANELAAAEQKVNDALDEQAAKAKEATSALDLSKQVGTLNFLAGEAKKAASVLSETNWSDADKEHYEQLIAIIGKYRKSKEKISDEELADIRNIVDGYKMQADAVRQAGEETKKAANVFGLKELKSASDRSINLNALTNGFNSKVITDGLENARQAYQRLVEYQQKFNDGHTATDKEKEAYKVLTNQYNVAAKAVEDLIKKSQKMANDSRWSVEIDPSDLDNLEQSMQKAIQASENGRVKFGQFNAETGKLEYSVRRANGTWDHFTAQVDEAGMAVVGLNGKVKTTNGILREFTSGISTKFKTAMQVFSGYDLFFEAIAQVKQGIQYVKDIDLALTELKKVTNETDEVYAHFLQTASQTSAVIGSTVADFTNATADFARLNI